MSPRPAAQGQSRTEPGADALKSTAPIRVASVPAGHVYVRHLSPVGESADPAVVRLADPDPDDPRRSAVSRWWPPVMLDADWVHAHADEFDVFHLQFGFDARTPDELRALVAALRAEGKPLVYTVHDLRNPHHADRREHDAQLDVLVPAADGLITLTSGAADEIARRWGRTALVVPHPHVVDLDTMERMRAVREESATAAGVATAAGDATASATGADASAPRPFRIGVHVKSLRASMDPLPVIETIARSIEERRLGTAILQVNGHADVLQPDGARYDAELAGFLRDAERRGVLELRIHDFFTDDELWEYLASLDVSVLPYRFGTHSGWLEACRDLGTAVVAPDIGYYADQGPVLSYHRDGETLDAESLERAVIAAMNSPRAEGADIGECLRQRASVAAAHLDLYRALLS